MATWPNVNNTNLSTQEDEYILFQNGINYVQDLKTLSGAIDQGEWTSTFKYYVNDITRGSNGRRYIATQNSGPDNGGVQDPVSSTTYWYDCTDVLKGEGDSAFSENADKLDGQHGSYYQNASNLNAGTVPTARLPEATATSKGVSRQATAQEALDGSDVNAYMPPNLVHAAFNQYGLGAGAETLADIDALDTPPGIYGVDFDVTEGELPTGFKNGVVEVWRDNSVFVNIQRLVSTSQEFDNADSRVFVRRYYNGGNEWTPWRELLHDGSLSKATTAQAQAGTDDEAYLTTKKGVTLVANSKSADSDRLGGKGRAFYQNRSNHTGTQPLSTISDAGTAAATNAVDIVAETVKNQTGGKWVVHESANGVPCVFYRMPAFSYDDLQIDNCPFTGVMDLFRNSDGSIRPYHDFAVYLASEQNGDLVSVGGGAPVNRINYDEFFQQASDSGFKMYGVYERACLNWLMIANNFQPRGNTEYGRIHEISHEFAQRQDGRVPNDRDGEARTLTGTGPNTWNHDGTEFGIADLVGNQWEWCDDLKMVDGEFVVAEYCGQPESEWSKTGRFIAPGHKFAMANRGDAKSSEIWSEFTKEDGYEGHELLQRLCIEPIAITRVLKGRFYYDTRGARSPVVGGNWHYGVNAGPAALLLYHTRSYRLNSIGGRLAKHSDS